ncbi:MAG: hypothetical protein V2A55_02275 [Candidatus Jorgensenbacteria bacterium]
MEQLVAPASPRYWFELSPNGEKLTYTQDDGEPCLTLPYVSNLDGSEAVRFGWGPTWAECEIRANARSPRWSPDGRTVITVGAWEPLGPTGPIKYTIFSLDVATGKVSHINVRDCGTKSVPCIDQVSLEVVWAPDGRSIYTTLWEKLENYEGRIHVVRIDLPSLAVTRLYTDATNNSPDFLGPSVYDVSKDGATLSLRIHYSVHSGRSPRLALLKTDGSGELRFITPPETGNPAWPTFCPVGGEERIFYVDKKRPSELRWVRTNATDDGIFYTVGHGIEVPRCQRPPSK